MNIKSLAQNVSVAFLAQGVAMALSVLQTLLVPKLLGTVEYGYWQLFIFYTTYVGLGHLGLNDGVYLIKGGQGRDSIDKRSVNSQFVFGLFFQLVIAFCIIIFALFGPFEADRTFVITCTGIYLVVQNAANFLSYLLQAMNETKLSSYSKIVERLTFLLPLIVLLIVRYKSFKPFVISYILSSFVQFLFCLWFCRDFIVSGFDSFPETVADSWHSVCVGFKLAMANIASQLILGISRFAIDASWGIKTFGELSLALSLVGFFLQFVTQASMVLFPALRQSSSSEVKSFFINARDFMYLFFPVIYLLYFPLVTLLSLWLPAYANSFVFFAFLIPICVFDSKMNICCTTLFKVLRRETDLLRINLLTCFISALFTAFGVYCFHSVFFVIGSVVIALIGRSLIAELFIASELGSQVHSVEFIREVCLTFVFVTCVFVLPMIQALCIYLFAYFCYLFLSRKKLHQLVSKINGLRIKG